MGLTFQRCLTSIKFTGGQQVVSDCNFFNSDNSTYAGSNSYIRTLSANITITNSTFQNNIGYAINADGSIVSVSSSTFQQITYPIYTFTSNLTVSSSTFQNNNDNRIIAYYSNINISSSTFLNNQQNIPLVSVFYSAGILVNITIEHNSCNTIIDLHQSNITIQESSLKYNNSNCYTSISLPELITPDNTIFCGEECGNQPTSPPTSKPTSPPTSEPTFPPTSKPTSPTSEPTSEPTSPPTSEPTSEPTSLPTRAPNGTSMSLNSIHIY